jgi:DNA modification methylase
MIRNLHGDCREILRTLPDASVHCCVTSPPYFGLRDYGTAQWDGGDPDCDHTIARSRGDDIKPGDKQGRSAGSRPNTQRVCSCGARRIDNQIGLESTPDEYVAQMVAVFREVRRVLRDDGTLWLNLGDSYASAGGVSQPHRNSSGGFSGSNGLRTQGYAQAGGGFERPNTLNGSLKPKDLIGIPWRVAFALQADGWWLRQDIIWSKPNPMPESVTDRCTKSHEYIFLLSKSARYYYDADAIAEAVSPNTHARISQDLANQIGSERAHAGGKTNGNLKAVVKGSSRKLAMMGSGIKNNESFVNAVCLLVDKRNKRSVWEVATQPYSEAHFATFPPMLIEPCIKAGCHVGGTVLDPFGGTGTTGMVADRLQRNAILIELNPDYLALGNDRLADDAGMFAEILST